MNAKTINNLPRVLHHWATHDPDTAAFVFVDSVTQQRRVLTRADVFRLASRFAAILRRHDVRAGDVVVNTLPNSPERLLSDLGVVLAGAVAMNGQIFLADGEDFLGSLRQSSAVAVILDPLDRRGAATVLSQLETSKGGRDECGKSADESVSSWTTETSVEHRQVRLPAVLYTSDLATATPANLQSLPSLRLLFSCLYSSESRPSFMQCLESATESYVHYEASPDDVAWVFTTSGTTGFSKLVPHTHRRLLRYGVDFALACGIEGEPPNAIGNDDARATVGVPVDADVRNVTTTAPASDSSQNSSTATKSDNATTDSSDTTTKRDNTAIQDDKAAHAVGRAIAANATSSGNSANTPAFGAGSSSGSPSTTRYAKVVYFNNGRLGWSGGFPGVFLSLGATRVLLDVHRGPPADPAVAMWRAAVAEGCHHAFFLPVLWNMLLERPELWAGQGFRFKVVGLAGQPVHADLVKKAVGKLADNINVFYGTTDTGIVSMKPVTMASADHYDDYNNGKPIAGAEIKVVVTETERGAEQGAAEGGQQPAARKAERPAERPAGPGELGEVFVRTATVLTSYLNNAEATRKAIHAGGWVTVGDVGYLDSSGDLHVVCRTAFAILRGAYVLYPGWLESRLRQHPAVRDVVVVPVPDSVVYQELCACVVPRAEAEVTAEELREWSELLFLTAKEDHMTAVPKYFLFFPDQLPCTPQGKTCRRTTEAKALERLRMGSAASGAFQ